MIKQIELNGRIISYDLQIKPVKNVNLRIKPDQSVFVSANESVSPDVIDEFLKSKTDYIVGALDHYAELQKYAPKPKEYVDGETFRILGHELRLKVSQGTKNQVTTDGAYILLQVKNPADYEMKKRTIEKWQKKQCEDILLSVCQSVYPKFQKYGVDFPTLRYRYMVSRWGSCQPKRKVLTFNFSLLEAPLACIEYVAVHEFTHFLQPNHSRKFYQQLAMFMPDWRSRKELLDNNRTYHL